MSEIDFLGMRVDHKLRDWLDKLQSLYDKIESGDIDQRTMHEVVETLLAEMQTEKSRCEESTHSSEEYMLLPALDEAEMYLEQMLGDITRETTQTAIDNARISLSFYLSE